MKAHITISKRYTGNCQQYIYKIHISVLFNLVVRNDGRVGTDSPRFVVINWFLITLNCDRLQRETAAGVQYIFPEYVFVFSHLASVVWLIIVRFERCYQHRPGRLGDIYFHIFVVPTLIQNLYKK